MYKHEIEEGEIDKKRHTKSKINLTLGKYSSDSSAISHKHSKRRTEHSKKRHRSRSRSKSRKDKYRRHRNHKHDRSRSHSKGRKHDRKDSLKHSSPKIDVENLLDLKNENVNKYSTKRDKQNKIVEYLINEDLGEKDNSVSLNSNADEEQDYELQRQARRKRLDELKNKQQHLAPIHVDTIEIKNPDLDLNKQTTNGDRLSREDNEKLLKLVAQERDKNMQDLNQESLGEDVNIGNKTPDMFVETPVDDPNDNKKVINLPLFDSYEDTTGYYTPKINELLNERYKVTGLCGKGIFSTVVKVTDITSNLEYAVKIVRTIDIMLISGDKERNILKKLNAADNKDNSNIVKLIDTFDYKRHICMVFELYDMNLRELLKQKKRLGLNQVRSYAKQMLSAFDLLHSFKLIHADCKYFIKFR
jgi:hypothetical protein